MKILSAVLLVINTIYSQSYEVTFFGLHVAQIKQKIYKAGRIDWEVQSRGIIDLIWPLKNNYTTFYNTETFELKSLEKNIKQDLNKYTLKAKMDSTNNYLAYDGQQIKNEGPFYTFFTMIAMVQSSPIESIDTKWFPYEYEGKTGRSRFLWSDSLKIWGGKDSIMCDHYRMDINITDSTYVVNNTKDYFMEHINDSKHIKEVWIKRGKNKTMVQAGVKNDWITLLAKTDI